MSLVASMTDIDSIAGLPSDTWKHTLQTYLRECFRSYRVHLRTIQAPQIALECNETG